MSKAIQQNTRHFERRFQVSGYVPKPVKTRIDAVARKKGITTSRLVADLVTEFAASA